MRITIAHERTKQEVIDAIDRSFNEMFQGMQGIPVKINVQQKTWEGSLLTFALTASMGFMSSPIKGTVEVTDHDLTVDADLGLLSSLISQKAASEMIGSRIKGLLK
jgi:hypothetical protein